MASAPTLETDLSSLESATEPENDTQTDDSNLTLALYGMAVVAVAIFMFDRGAHGVFGTTRYDEHISLWVTSAGPWDAVVRSYEFQGQSPLYFVILWAWRQVAGASVFALRLPSILALGAAVWGLVRIGRDIGKVQVGIIAAAFYVVMSTQLLDARPYAFLGLSVVLALHYGMRWATPEGTIVDGVRWAVFAVAVLYFHPLALWALVPHAALFIRAGVIGRWRQSIGLAVLGGALLVPLVPQVLSLNARGDTLVLVAPPDLSTLLSAVFPLGAVIGIAVAAIANVRQDWLQREYGDWFSLFVLGMVAPGLGLFFQSWLTGESVFVVRYLLPALPLSGLVLGSVILSMRTVAVCGGVVAAALFGASAFGPATYLPDWNFAAEQLATVDSSAEVWTMGGLIESYHPWYFETDNANEYLSNHLRVTGVDRALLSIPGSADEDVAVVHQRNVARLAASGAAVAIVDQHMLTADGSNSGPDYAIELLLEQEYEIIAQDTQGGVTVTRLERS